MKIFIRTKDGKIIDLHNFHYTVVKNKVSINGYFYEIVKQADSIEGLIEVGDLVNYDGKILEVKKELNLILLSDGTILDECSFRFITELYTKQGRNYVLVWTKEEGVI